MRPGAYCTLSKSASGVALQGPVRLPVMVWRTVPTPLTDGEYVDFNDSEKWVAVTRPVAEPDKVLPPSQAYVNCNVS